jgi:hypothetical protein
MRGDLVWQTWPYSFSATFGVSASHSGAISTDQGAQLEFIPEDSAAFVAAAKQAKLRLRKRMAIFIHGDDRPGAIADMLAKLAAAHMNGDKYTVDGVMRPDFSFPFSTSAAWIPIDLTPEQIGDIWDHYLNAVVGRLRPGVTVQRANAALLLLSQQLAREYPAPSNGRIERFFVERSRDARLAVRPERDSEARTGRDIESAATAAWRGPRSGGDSSFSRAANL